MLIPRLAHENVCTCYYLNFLGLTYSKTSTSQNMHSQWSPVRDVELLNESMDWKSGWGADPKCQVSWPTDGNVYTNKPWFFPWKRLQSSGGKKERILIVCRM